MAIMKIGRSAVDGKFTTVREAQKAPRTHVVETIKIPSRTSVPSVPPSRPKK